MLVSDTTREWQDRCYVGIPQLRSVLLRYLKKLVLFGVISAGVGSYYPPWN